MTKVAKTSGSSRRPAGKAVKPPAILPAVRGLIEASRQRAVAYANLTLVARNWHIGRVITEDIQRQPGRADYGEQLIERLAQALTRDYGEGFSLTNLSEMRRFFEHFEIFSAPPKKFVTAQIDPSPADEQGGNIFSAPPKKLDSDAPAGAPAGESPERIVIDFAEHDFVSWTHYRQLLALDTGLKRRFYFEQITLNRWSTRELERRVAGALFERVGLSRDTRRLVAMEQRKPAEVADYTTVFKDPYLLDFLGLQGAYSERDLEAGIIRNLEEFLAELGNDFCFIRRQYPMRVDDVDHRLDLLFYHRGLRCLVAIDLKLGAFTAADKGQMDLYLAWLKERDWREGENEPVGLVLCSSKRKQHVELLLRAGPHKLAVSEYRTMLPDKKLLEGRLRLYSQMLRATE